MLLPTIIASCLLFQDTVSQVNQKRWSNGDSASDYTDPDVTSDCEYWVNDISSTDTCAELETYFGITIAELHAWNPSLLEDYCELIKGWSYYVEGPAVTAIASVSTSTRTAIPIISFSEVSDDVSSTSWESVTAAAITMTTTTYKTTGTPTSSGKIPSPT
ncbi:LysM domain protein [Penicillium taxi]|uniref:LysM domain protein n=1 Tax=Penicillium taxi TaxID=168475 RepID=UPI002544F09A|nr:LysM domain protein [Penicillium taxi]KAJ5893483.1 LysM domain protein [Penicillium taxi]